MRGIQNLEHLVTIEIIEGKHSKRKTATKDLGQTVGRVTDALKRCRIEIMWKVMVANARGLSALFTEYGVSGKILSTTPFPIHT